MAYVPLPEAPDERVTPPSAAAAAAPRQKLGVDSVSLGLSKQCLGIDAAVPAEATWLRRLLLLSHWPAGPSRAGAVVGNVAMVAAYATRAVWSTAFLVLFGMGLKGTVMLTFPFFAMLCIMAMVYHRCLLEEPYVLHMLLQTLDADGKGLARIEVGARRGVLVGFLGWGFSWCISWWLVFLPSAKQLEDSEAVGQSLRHLILLLLPVDFVFGRALEHKDQFFSLYIRETHELLAQSIKQFGVCVEEILSAEDTGEDAREYYEALHEVECKMRAHVKWVNDVEGEALLIYLAQEASSAIYTAAVALFTEQPELEFCLISYSLVQLLMLFRTGLDLAKPGDQFKATVSNLDTPRTLYMLQVKLQTSAGAGPLDYIAHLQRSPAGIKIYRTLVFTPLVIRTCVTLAVPTIGVIFRSLTAYMETTPPA